MELENILLEIEAELELIVNGIGAEAGVPVKSGNLRSAIKLRKMGPMNYQLYIDEEQAPYAGSIEDLKPYWNRVAMALSYRLAAKFGGDGRRDDTPNIK
jgi:hypothetical protein